MGIQGRLAIYVVLAAIVLTAVLSGLDYLLTRETITFGDVATDLVEMMVLSAGMVISAAVVVRLRNLETATSNMQRDLNLAAEAGRAWRAQSEHVFKGLSAAVAAQFEAWGLTDAEAEVASLILKGVALKEIAALRRTSDGTIRQQAQSIYRKSGLNNRSELSAFFLEDLFDIAGARATAQGARFPKH